MKRPFAWPLVPFGLALVLLASCTSMDGDLGRPERGSTTSSLFEFGGEVRSKLNGELYSNFNVTDEETTMRNKAWVLIRPPHAQDWISSDLWEFFPSIRNVGLHVLTETQRTRLTPVIDTAFEPKYYYRALRASRYASHHVRYDRVTTDINEDREAFAAFIPTAERVVTMDAERMAALGRLADMDPRQMKDAYARVDENRRFIGWVWRAVQFRMRAYAYAIKRLEIETPSPKVLEANRALKELSREFEAQNGTLGDARTDDTEGDVKRSRYTRRQWAKEDPNLVK
ncbi:hypothetical protein C0081_13075 [Cohaesibacter celericrescens]|uniref:Uncharacterized protein n=1 Tax=Cohaesibacter celericrescens TaxID=2067669 RepID=A0A2N5XR31_9HYPH|nr:hypothetical protein C0081_13075 [Cohaesibacter celericrescens]